MSFKWDWEKGELVEGEKPKGVREISETAEFILIPGLLIFGYVFVQYIAPWLGHILLGGFL